MSSGLIYAAIVVMWAVVLVPMFLRRHDQSVETKSVDRFSTAMRILSRRGGAAPDQRYIVMPRRPASRGASLHVSGAGTRRVSHPAAVLTPRSAARARLLARRRRLALILLAAAAGSGLLALVRVVPWWLQILVDLVVAADVIHLRAQAIRAAAVSRPRSRAATGANAMPRSATAPPDPAAAAAGGSAASWRASGSVEDAAASEATGTEGGWQPIPVPPPTYTLKPPAPRRAVGESRSDEWSGPLLEDDFTVELALDGDALEDILERRRAVND